MTVWTASHTPNQTHKRKMKVGKYAESKQERTKWMINDVLCLLKLNSLTSSFTEFDHPCVVVVILLLCLPSYHLQWRNLPEFGNVWCLFLQLFDIWRKRDSASGHKKVFSPSLTSWICIFSFKPDTFPPELLLVLLSLPILHHEFHQKTLFFL